MATSTIIFDSTFTRNYTSGGNLIMNEPLAGTSLSMWLPLGVVMPFAPPKYVPKSSDFLRVIDAVIAKRPIPTGKDVFRYYGPAPYSTTLCYPPKITPHSFQLDWEASWLANLAPSYYAGIMSAIKQKHPAIRLLTYVPYPLQGFDDNPLKQQLWTPTQTTITAAKSFATRNKPWIDQLWGLVISCYFGAPKHDELTIWWAYNLIKLARLVFPNRRIVLQTCGGRETSWYPAGGIVPDSVSQKFAGVIRSAHPEGVIIWGPRSANLKMLAAFGIKATTSSTTLVPSTNLQPISPTGTVAN